MDYRAELQILLDDDSMILQDWLKQYPLEEYPGLIQEFKIYMQKFLIEQGDFQAVQELEDELTDYSEYVENLIFDKLAERQKKMIEAEALMERIKNLLKSISQIESKDIFVSDELLDDFREMVEYLKSEGLFDEETLRKLQHLL